MPAYDFRSPRLFVKAPLAAGAEVPLDRAQAHYLTTVLRRKSGDGVLVFNGRDGEWSAELDGRKRDVALPLLGRHRARPRPVQELQRRARRRHPLRGRPRHGVRAGRRLRHRPHLSEPLLLRPCEPIGARICLQREFT